ncbi:MAG: MAPEG family protein [Alphaproteobacteria bacterium]|nr:MAPEG family protein [Alphaproteobacteria bacterium]
MITGLYAAILMLFQLGLTLQVVQRRRETKTSLGTGKDEELERRVRTHGNFVETVPMALILILIAELSGAPYWMLHIVALALVIGRGMHIYAIMKTNFTIRVWSMYLTIFSWFGAAGLCVWTAVTTILG